MLKHLLRFLQYKRVYLSLYFSWSKRFSKSKNLLAPLTKGEKKRYKKKWFFSTGSVNAKTVELVKGLTDSFNIDIVPEEIFSADIEKTLNNRDDFYFFTNKSIYEKWFNGFRFPKCYLHNINGGVYDSELAPISDLNAYLNEFSNVDKFIIKPNINSYGGKGVLLVNGLDELKKNLSKYESDFLVQECIEPNLYLSNITKQHFYSIRLCTYSSVKTNKCHVLNVTLRMGANGSLDNETSGGYYLNINDSGEFSSYAFNKNLEKIYSHPNSLFPFMQGQLPYYDDLKKMAISLAKLVPMARLISFDFTLDENNKWRPIELNLRGQTIRFAQHFGVPFFGKFTEEVIEYTKKYHWSKI